MMNVQSFPQFFLGNITSLALMPITGTNTTRLPFPIGTIIWIIATAPDRIIFASPILGFPSGKTLAIAIKHISPINLVWLSFKLIATPVAVHCYSLFRATCNQLARPFTHALTITKVMLFDGTGGNAFFLATPIAGNNPWGILALAIAIMLLPLAGLPVLAFPLFTTVGTDDHYPLLRCFSGTLRAAIFFILDKIRLELKYFAAMLASKWDQLFWPTHFLACQFPTTFIGTSKSAIMLDLPIINHIGFIANWTSSFKFHKIILTQMLVNVKYHLRLSAARWWDGKGYLWSSYRRNIAKLQKQG